MMTPGRTNTPPKKKNAPGNDSYVFLYIIEYRGLNITGTKASIIENTAST